MLKSILVRRKFLVRLIVVIVTTISLALLITNLLIVKRAHRYVTVQNEATYMEAASMVANYVNEQIQTIYQNAVKLSRNEKTSRSTVESHVFHQIELISALDEYRISLPLVYELYLYYDDADYVMSSKAKYNMDFFLSIQVGANEAEAAEAMADFLAETHTESWCSFSTFGMVPQDEAMLLICVPVSVSDGGLGLNALAMYAITEDSLRSTFVSTMGKNADLVIINKEGTVIYQSRNAAADLPYLLERQENHVVYDTENTTYNAFIYEGYFTYAVIVSETALDSSLEEYSDAMNRAVLSCILVMLVVCVMTIYLSYNPVKKMVRRYADADDIDEIVDELAKIEGLLDRTQQRNDEMGGIIRRQNHSIAEGITTDLADGHTVSPERITWFAREYPARYYLAAAVGGIRLNNTSRALLEERLNRREGLRALVIDAQRADELLVVWAINDDSDARSLAEELSRSVFLLCGVSAAIGMGEQTPAPDQLYHGCSSAMTALHFSGGGVTWYDSMVTHTAHMFHYPAKEIFQYLHELEKGDEAAAMAHLAEALSKLNEHSWQVARTRYACMEICGEFIRQADKLGFPLTEDETDRLIACDAPDVLRTALADMTAALCRRVAEKKNMDENEADSQLIRYVNEHFFDPDISLTHVGDVLNLSVYTVSRKFKETTGTGFREYVISKRLEMAKALLEQTNESLKSIAKQTGIGNPDYLTKQFKATYGILPSEYWKMRGF